MDDGSDVERSRQCDDHKLERKYYCVDCAEFICLTCGKSSHVGHDWKEIIEIIKELDELKEESKGTRKHNSVRMYQHEENLDHIKQIVCKKIQETKEGHKKMISEYEAHLLDFENNIDKMIAILGHQLSTPNLETGKKIKTLLDPSTLDANMDRSVIQTNIKTEGSFLKILVGPIIDFSKTKLVQASHFTTKNVITQIVSRDDSLAWVGSRGEKEVKLVNMEGKVLKSCKLPVALESFTIGKTNEICLTIASNMTIRTVDIPRPQKVSLRMHPTSLCMTSTSDLLVTTVSNFIKPDGHVLKGNYGSSNPLKPKCLGPKTLTYPVKIIESSKGDICVLNKVSNKPTRTQIVLLQANGTLSYDQEDPSDITDITFDSYGNIICAENDKNTIALVRLKDVRLVKTNLLHVEKPVALSCCANSLWYSTESGEVHIHKIDYFSTADYSC